TTTLYTPSATALYRITIEGFVDSSAVGTSTLDIHITFRQNGKSQVGPAVTGISATTPATANGSIVGAVYADAGVDIDYYTTWTPGGAGDSYDLHIRVEEV
ncbi:MAG: hypothetical protein KGI66_02060, partial [Patescibacteria group bacterium]|nr:hypothetical protein [Patescibacteria group bacterium]